MASVSPLTTHSVLCRQFRVQVGAIPSIGVFKEGTYVEVLFPVWLCLTSCDRTVKSRTQRIVSSTRVGWAFQWACCVYVTCFRYVARRTWVYRSLHFSLQSFILAHGSICLHSSHSAGGLTTLTRRCEVAGGAGELSSWSTSRANSQRRVSRREHTSQHRSSKRNLARMAQRHVFQKYLGNQAVE